MQLYGRLLLAIVFGSLAMNAQQGYWQQSADYIMDIDFDTENHQFKGEQQFALTKMPFS